MRKCGNWVLNDCLARHSNLEVVVGLLANGASRILAEGFLEIRVESAQTIRLRGCGLDITKIPSTASWAPKRGLLAGRSSAPILYSITTACAESGRSSLSSEH